MKHFKYAILASTLLISFAAQAMKTVNLVIINQSGQDANFDSPYQYIKTGSNFIVKDQTIKILQMSSNSNYLALTDRFYYEGTNSAIPEHAGVQQTTYGPNELKKAIFIKDFIKAGAQVELTVHKSDDYGLYIEQK